MINYTLITKTDDLRLLYPALSEAEVIGVDTETTSLHPRNGNLRLIQLSDGDSNTFIIDVFQIDNKEILIEELSKLFCNQNIKKVFHNAKFDIGWIKEKLGIEVKGIFCTYLAAKLIDMSADAKINSVLNKFLDITIDKEEQKSDWSGRLTSSQLMYASRDVLFLPKLRKAIIVKLKRLDLLNITKIEFDAVPAVAQIETTGFPVDLKMYNELVSSLKIKRDVRGKELEAFLNDVMGNNPITRIQGGLFGDDKVVVSGTININSTQQVLEALQKAGVPLESTNAATIQALLPKYPQLQLLSDYRGDAKLVSSFGDKFLLMVDQSTSRIYANFWQLNPVTGRFSVSNPNLQQIPHSEDFRECFRPTNPDRVLCIADYGGMELRILAQLSQDEVMLNAFKHNQDLHSLTAINAFGLKCDLKDVKAKYPNQRQMAKQLNFGIVYGIGANKYAASVGIDPKDARKAINGFYDTYQGAKKYLYSIEDYGVAHGYVTTVAGRRMNLIFDRNDEGSIAQARRNARNYPIQGACADVVKHALGQLYINLRDNFPTARIVNTVHDEILVECDKVDSLAVKDVLSSTMIRCANEYLPDVVIEADANICSSWAEK